MVQGTASSAGKTVLVAGLCRYFANRGLRVAPFKSQNMALNSFATRNGLEMGRAQVVQAQACRVEPRVEMNPILLKPEGDRHSQLVLMGRVEGRYSAVDYHQLKPQLLDTVAAALDTLRAQFDLVVIEGAGSPAEINLAEHDIVNMRIAELADAPVLLVGDIDRGGVFAALLGTLELLPERHRQRVQALIVNKFRGDRELLRSGLDFISQRTGKPVLGVVPYVSELGLPEEDSVALETAPVDGPIAVIQLPHISNFDDFDPLPVRYVKHASELHGARAVIIPGTKATMSDLGWLERSGLASSIRGCGLPVAGICGGFQMLGQRILDPQQVESDAVEMPGLGMLPVETTFFAGKTTIQARATTLDGGHDLAGYQIHMGQTTLLDGARPFARLTDGSFDGAAQGRVWGTYLHGVFHNPTFRRAWLAEVGVEDGPHAADDPFDRLATVLAASLDLALLHRIAGLD